MNKLVARLKNTHDFYILDEVYESGINTPIKLTKDGTLYCKELREDTVATKFFNSGIISVNQFSEVSTFDNQL